MNRLFDVYGLKSMTKFQSITSSPARDREEPGQGPGCPGSFSQHASGPHSFLRSVEGRTRTGPADYQPSAQRFAGGVEPIPSDDQFHRSFRPLGLSIKKLSLILPGCTEHSQVPRHTHVAGTRQDVRDGPGPSSPIFSQKINR